MLKNSNFLIFGSLILIVLAIGLVAILNRTSSSSSTTNDVRARAATSNILKVNATVASIDETERTMMVGDVYFADSNRSGEAKNLGVWLVTVPASINLIQFIPGSYVVIGVDSKTFLASNHTMTAFSIVPDRR